jgi:hypothetical protein
MTAYYRFSHGQGGPMVRLAELLRTPFVAAFCDIRWRVKLRKRKAAVARRLEVMPVEHRRETPAVRSVIFLPGQTRGKSVGSE